MMRDKTARQARGAVLLIALLGGCATDRSPRSPAPPVAPPASRDAPPAAPPASSVVDKQRLHLEGTVRLPPDAEPARARKVFRGAFLEDDSGTRWVLDYREASPFRALKDRRVIVEGHTYAPEGQALVLPHLRVASMKLAKVEPGPELVEVGGEEQLTGHFEEFSFGASTKLAGEKWLRFAADGGEHFLVLHGADGDALPPLGAPVVIHAFPVEPSPFVARPGGPYLWIM